MGYIRISDCSCIQTEESKNKVDDQNQREEEYRRMEDMVREDRQKVKFLEMERDSLRKQVARLQLEASTKDGQLKEKINNMMIFV